MNWPTECPKCGMDHKGAGQSHMQPRYCGWCLRAMFRGVFNEHMHIMCGFCRYEGTDPCKDAGEEPAK